MRDDRKVGRGYIELGNIKGERGDREAAIEYYIKAIQVLEELDDTEELSRAYNNLSDTYYKVDQFDKSVEYADKSIELAKESDNARLEGFGYMTGGEALLEDGGTWKRPGNISRTPRKSYGTPTRPTSRDACSPCWA